MVAERVIHFRKPVGRASVAARMRDVLKEEVHALRDEASRDALFMRDPAARLRESAIRDGRFHDYQDAVALLARVERMRRRGDGGRAA